jgi:hypothetical protein
MWGCTGPNPAFSPAPTLDGSGGSGGAGGQPVGDAGAETAAGGSGGGQGSDGPVGDIAFEVAAGEVMDALVDIVSPLDAADLPPDLAPDRAPDLPADLPSDLPADGPVPVGTGLRGQYFDGSMLEAGDTGALEMTRDNEAIDFDWGTGSPDGRVDDDWFSVRWTGKVMPRFSETYTFRTVADEGVRLWVNRQLIIDRWTATNASVTNTGTISLQAYTQYEIKVEYFEQTGAAVARLSWMSSSQPLQIIPRANLFMPTP